ncbi:MAG: signal recognition particle-docking protein FtsY [Pseudomonadota bacterium]
MHVAITPLFTQMSIISKIPFGGRLSALFRRSAPDEGFWEELEKTLVEADVGVDAAAGFMESVRGGRTVEDVKRLLASLLSGLFVARGEGADASPRVILVLGVNGVGKTTTIAKLARLYQGEGKRVLLVAADTFRAAAVEQLKEWGSRLGLEVVAQREGADAAAVAFDGVQKARARGHDIVIIDTAGRLHTKQNLMEELKKISRVIDKAMPGAPHERWLVLDATVGANGLAQARRFHDAVGLTGAIVAKLDGTAKGGIVFAVASELRLPITHIGVGERMEDLEPFDPRAFVDSILN